MRSNLKLKSLVAAATLACAAALTATEASAAVTILFDPANGSAEDTGAAASAMFTFTQNGGAVGVDVVIKNLTNGTYGDGATAATLLAMAFDMPTLTTITYNAGTSNWAYFDSNGASLPPYGAYDYSISKNSNITGGNPGGGLLAGATLPTVSFSVTGGGTAAALENAFLTGYQSGSLNAVVRFQQVSGGSVAGEASDKVLGKVGGPPMGAVPEPATWAMMIGGFAAVGSMLRRRRAVLA